MRSGKQGERRRKKLVGRERERERRRKERQKGCRKRRSGTGIR